MSRNQDQGSSSQDSGQDEKAVVNESPDPVQLPPKYILEPNPDITIYLTGLMLMAYNSTDKRVEVGVVSNVPNHKFKIYVKKISRRTVSLFETHFDQSTPLTNEIRFSVDGATGDRVAFYQNNPFDRDSFSNFFGTDDYGVVSIDDVRDFRWIMDFEGRELHDTKLTVNARLLSPRLYISDGVFYTARRTFRTFNRITQNVPKSKIYYGAVGHVIAANITLQGTQVGRLSIGSEINLPFPKEDGTSYKIAFVNDPGEEIPKHNDFKEYYNVLVDEQSHREFDLCPFDDKNDCSELPIAAVPPGAPPPGTHGLVMMESQGAETTQTAEESNEEEYTLRSGSDRVPCASGFLGRSNGLFT